MPRRLYRNTFTSIKRKVKYITKYIAIIYNTKQIVKKNKNKNKLIANTIYKVREKIIIELYKYNTIFRIKVYILILYIIYINYIVQLLVVR